MFERWVSQSSRLALALAVLFVLGTTGAWAQGGGTGELSGIITDPSGALIPGAQITLTNTATGAVRTAVTDETGAYRFVALPVVGTYTLRVTAENFRTQVVENIVISVGRVVTYDVALELGPVDATMTVEAGVQLVQPTESHVSDVLQSRVWQSMPLEFRNQNVFINLLPGVVPDDFGGTTRGAAVSGARPGMGNFLVEGYDNNDQGQGGRGAIVPGAITSISPEAIQEYRVIAHNYTAEYGKGGAFVTDTVLKSGTNQYHGSLFAYNRVQALAANSFFSNAAGLEDRLVRNQFGGSFGGPLAPQLRDKTFFHASYEGHIRRQSAPITATSFTQEFLDFVESGQFRTFHETDPQGFCMQNVGASCAGAFANSATTGPIFRQLMQVSPVPLASASSPNTSNVGAGLLSAGIVYPVPVYGDVTVLNRDKFDEHRISLKVDHKLTDKDQLSGTWLHEDSDQSQTVTGGDNLIGPPFVSPGSSVLIGVTWTRTFTPRVLNQFRASYLRHVRDFPNAPGLEGVPSVVTAFDPMGISFGNSSGLPQFFTDNLFQYQDHVSIVHGKHTFKVGGDYRRTRNGSSFEAVRNGLFLPYGVEELLTDGFWGDEADIALFGAPVFGSHFFAQASINPITGGLPEFYRGYRANEVSWYFQDDWRLHPRLTLNWGLRWEYFGVPHNFREGLDSNFFFGSPLTPIPHPSGNAFFPFDSAQHAMVFNGQFIQRDNNIWAKDTNNFAPRVGLAWDVFGTQKLILRTGGGIFYDRIWNNLFENIRFNAPFFSFATLGTFVNGVPVGAISTPGILSSPFTGTSLFGPFGGLPSPRHMDENLVTAYTEQFYLGAQWEFLRDWVLEVNGVGTLGRKLHGVIDINTFNGRTRGGDGRRPNLTMAGDNFRTNAFKSNYYGLQMAVRKAFSSGLQMNANYTWSHAIDEVSDAFNNGRGALLRPTNNFDIRRDRGNADFDIRHRFVVSYLYELPWLRENRWLGGWTLSGISSLQTGTPIPLFDSGFDANADGYFTDRPLFIGGGAVQDATLGGNPADGYIDTSQFRRIAADGSDCRNGMVLSATQWWCDSPLGRNNLTGPGFVNFDFSVQKRFRVTEAVGLQFQANFFNIFNHANFATPVGNLNSSAFGSSQATLGNPRVTQLALRLDW